MSTDNTFRISEWIGKGEKWASAPSMLRKIAAAVFAVPQELELVLLPSPSLSIAKMLDFTLPLEHPESKGPKPGGALTYIHLHRLYVDWMVLKIFSYATPDAKERETGLSSIQRAACSHLKSGQRNPKLFPKLGAPFLRSVGLSVGPCRSMWAPELRLSLGAMSSRLKEGPNRSAYGLLHSGSGFHRLRVGQDTLSLLERKLKPISFLATGVVATT
ncbi:hypothetical protein C8F04DRAFT_1182078 [Mycena alexandri]|uniref:Uncharacterized protein n=1 Tax=Mycena alexandri TaxID=1745969 RepID=A0AAD6X8A2_9AGAR|nr:hypothetical protein C8F04DRAFT_1182078 [Mycena alexandri]